jgi:hypothetical protein
LQFALRFACKLVKSVTSDAWFSNLRDIRAKAPIAVRLHRVVDGNFRDVKPTSGDKRTQSVPGRHFREKAQDRPPAGRCSTQDGQELVHPIFLS